MTFLNRWRWWAILALPIAVIAVNSFGPDGWREPLVRLLWLSWTAVCVALTHSARKALYDYANGRDAWQKAIEHPIGAGLAFLGLCVVTAALFLGLASFAKAGTVQPSALQTKVPANAQTLAPMVQQEIERTWPSIPRRSYVGALVEQETCITLQHRWCWSPSAQLKTAREEGAGLGQFTRTWRGDGSLRFDALTEVRAMAPTELAELDWASVYQRADLGIRALLIKLRDCDTRLQRLGKFDDLVRVAFCDAAYNGGYGGLQSDRKLCALTKGCNPKQWFEHVENTSNRSRTKWQGYGKSAFEINREHVNMTLNVRRLKYAVWLGV